MQLKLFSILALITFVININFSEEKLSDTYIECKNNKTRCFGFPHECEASQSCKVLLSAKPNQNGADFVLYFKYDPKNADRWAAAGLSSDTAMGDDSVTECIIWKNNTVTARQGLTFAGVSEEDYGVKTVEPVTGIANEKGSFTDGIVSCSWTRAIDTHVKTLDFNIKDKKYFVIMAYGTITGTELDSHAPSNHYTSLAPVYLANPI